MCARSSWRAHAAVMSLPPQPRLRHSIRFCSTTAASGMGTPNSLARSVARPRSLRATPNRLEQFFRRDTSLGSQREAFGDGGLNDESDLVVDQLGHRARADFADVGDLVADAEQGWFDLLENVGVRPDHDLQ